MPGETGPTVDATQTSLEVLETVHRLEGAGVTAVAVHLDIPKSTAHKHLQTLVSMGYVEKQGANYDLDVTLYRFSQYTENRRPLLSIAREQVDRLASTTQQTAGLYVARHGRGFDVYRTDDPDVPVGLLPRHLHCTAPGKAILAELPDETVSDLVDEFGLPELTSETITTPEDLAAERSRIQDRGIAFDREEFEVNVRGVAVPITVDDTVVGALYVVGDAKQLTGKWFDENTPGIVLSCVNSVEQELRAQR